MNINQNNMAPLINVISKKLGVPAEQIQKEFEQGKFDSALNNMSQRDRNMFQQAINNPQMVSRMMNTPQAQALYRKLSGE